MGRTRPTETATQIPAARRITLRPVRWSGQRCAASAVLTERLNIRPSPSLIRSGYWAISPQRSSSGARYSTPSLCTASNNLSSHLLLVAWSADATVRIGISSFTVRNWRFSQARSRTITSTTASSTPARRSHNTNKLAVREGTRRPRMTCEKRSSAPRSVLLGSRSF